ncbi:hypothetical protein DFQ28_011700 [Apophysomyces sp. BC1034]|nr:hypothetical protein DFQ30_000178 [Apophysomyces sp. BC1015]KAG0168588.1 hypothetical protein DFQ29_010097 [Apophysomyces sp. BC1021]KAG0184150.1 hypothetical protein DFQ28_011700 [Apophysomyces sp. BC1034]
MEVLKQTFEENYPEIKKSILEADFISIDAEFTGLTTSANSFYPHDDLDTRYQKIRANVKEYTIVQYGVCAFKTTSDGYIAKPYNFYIFGCDTSSITSSRSFGSNASSLSFLRENNFDFNKLIDGGIPFYNYPEEAASFQTSHTTFMRAIPAMSPRQQKHLILIRQQIKQWLQQGTYKPLTVQTNNSTIKVFVRQELQRPEYGGFLRARVRDTKHMEIFKINDEERNKQRNPESPLLNFRRVIELIQDAGCPVVAHNGIFDLCHTIEQFWTYLPEEINELKTVARKMWPNFVDTKYLAEFHPQLSGCFNTSVLGSLYNTVEEELRNGGPKVVMADGYNRYSKENGMDNALHEAGYDAFMTGVVYLGFVHYIKEKEEEGVSEGKEKTDTTESSTKITKGNTSIQQTNSKRGKTNKKAKSKSTTQTDDSPSAKENSSYFFSPSLAEHYNRIYSMRTTFPYIDLTGEETVTYSDADLLYLNNIPQELTTAAIHKLYSELQPLTISWISSSCAWIRTKPQKQITAVLGMLGKERVREFLPGGARQSEGTDCGITAQAATMELLSHEQWKLLGSQDKPSSSGENSEEKNEEVTLSEDTTEHNSLPNVPTGGFGYEDLDLPIPDSFSSHNKRRGSEGEDEVEHKRKLLRYE